MKRILSVALTLVLVLGLVACGGEETPTVNDENDVIVSTENDTVVSTQNETTDSNLDESEKSNEAWREFLADYEDWVDSYITLYKKYQSNPTDMSLLSEYTKLAGEVSTWATRAEDIEDSLDVDDLTEYTSSLARIVEKLNSALY